MEIFLLFCSEELTITRMRKISEKRRIEVKGYLADADADADIVAGVDADADADVDREVCCCATSVLSC